MASRPHWRRPFAAVLALWLLLSPTGFVGAAIHPTLHGTTSTLNANVPATGTHSTSSAHGARFRIVLNKVEVFLHHPHNSSTCGKPEIKQIREFLAHAGVTLSSYEGK